MGSFEEHMRNVRSQSVKLSLLAGSLIYLQFDEILYAVGIVEVALFFTHIGAVFPDIDHHSAKPFRTLRVLVKYAAMGAAFLIVGSVFGKILVAG